ncbi:nif-specific regulatory [Apiospora phragmitis]|uniref:Nif-specific regulatory n=1 Tax=Apiospora phragmitis TaxID=2905665 RepID=A0ABR1WSR9_9PEZI
MGLNQDDAQQDFMIMNVFKSYQRQKGTGSNIDEPNGGRRLLENMVYSPAAPRHVAYIQGQRPSVEHLSESLGVSSSSLRDEPGLGSSILSGLAPGVVANNHASPAPPMSRQSSYGGAAMSRQGSGRGKRRC